VAVIGVAVFVTLTIAVWPPLHPPPDPRPIPELDLDALDVAPVRVTGRCCCGFTLMWVRKDMNQEIRDSVAWIP
jgi:hypothetical protein